MIYISWIALAIVCGALGDYRKVGGITAFFIALIFSPIVGFIVVALSERKQKKVKTVEFKNWQKYGPGRYIIESVHGDMVKLSGIPELVPKSELDQMSIRQ